MPVMDTLYEAKGASINRLGAINTVNTTQQIYAGADIIDRLTQRNNVTVARWWFMALVQRRGDAFDGIAFWMENKSSAASGWPGGYTSGTVTREYAMTIRELEHLIGIDLFPNLRILGPTIGRPNLEEAVENSPINWSRWPGI